MFHKVSTSKFIHMCIYNSAVTGTVPERETAFFVTTVEENQNIIFWS